MDATTKKAGLALISGVLIVTLGTGFALADATVDMAQEKGDTATIVAEYARYKSAMFERYDEYGLAYDETTDSLYYNGQLVRFFRANYPLDEYSYAGAVYYNENGVINVYGLQDSPITVLTENGTYSLTSVVSTSSVDNGPIKVHIVYDENGKVTGIEVAEHNHSSFTTVPDDAV